MPLELAKRTKRESNISLTTNSLKIVLIGTSSNHISKPNLCTRLETGILSSNWSPLMIPKLCNAQHTMSQRDVKSKSRKRVE